MIEIKNIRENPEMIGRAADWFSEKWNIDRALYLASLSQCVETAEPLPRWYLMMRGGTVIGGFGLIEHDFMVRRDLRPWLCALYIEPEEREQSLGARLLAYGVAEAAKLGFPAVWLNTDHIGYYEKYGWRYIGDFPHESGEDARVYTAQTGLLLQR